MNKTLPLDLESLMRTKLLPLPGNALMLSSMLLDYSVPQRKIVDAVGCDPMLALRLMRLANSPIYSFQQEVTTLNQAVRAVGNETIYEMILIGITAESFADEIHKSAIGQDIWNHCLAVAFVARELGLMLKIRGVDEAFICGLLHDIGSLILFRVDASLYSEVFIEGRETDLSSLEREVFGYDHAQIGALIARKWALPEPICNMILHHHDPTVAGEGVFMTHIINVADDLADLKSWQMPVEGKIMNTISVSFLNLKAAQLETVWEKASVNLESTLKAFA